MDDQTKADQEKKDSVDTQVQTDTSSNSQTETTKAPETETLEQINWRKFREDRERERKEKLEAEKKAIEKEKEAAALKAALETLVNKPVSNNYQDSYQELSDEDVMQQKIEAAIAARDKKAAQERKEREQKEYPQRIMKDFSDFNQVCSAENLDYLEYHYPEIAEAYNHMPDGYDKWASVYKATKKLIPNAGNAKKDSTQAQKNLTKPQSMSSQSAQTMGGDVSPRIMTAEMRAANWERMQKIMKGN